MAVEAVATVVVVLIDVAAAVVVAMAVAVAAPLVVLQVVVMLAVAGLLLSEWCLRYCRLGVVAAVALVELVAAGVLVLLLLLLLLLLLAGAGACGSGGGNGSGAGGCCYGRGSCCDCCCCLCSFLLMLLQKEINVFCVPGRRRQSQGQRHSPRLVRGVHVLWRFLVSELTGRFAVSFMVRPHGTRNLSPPAPQTKKKRSEQRKNRCLARCLRFPISPVTYILGSCPWVPI